MQRLQHSVVRQRYLLSQLRFAHAEAEQHLFVRMALGNRRPGIVNPDVKT
jgi:hypothetical protein